MNGKLAKKIRKASKPMAHGSDKFALRHAYQSLKQNVLAVKRSQSHDPKLKPQPVTAGTVPSKFKGFRKVRAPIWYGESFNGLSPTMYGSRWVPNTKSMMA